VPFKKLKLILIYSSGLFLVLILAFISLFKKIKFVSIEADNYGHFAYAINNYLNDIKLKNIKENEKYILWISTKKICNHFLLKKYKKIIKIYDYNIFFHVIFKTLKLLNLKSYIYTIKSWYEIEKIYYKIKPNAGYGCSFPSILNFSDDEKREGLKLLRKFGLEPDDKWVCIHNRDELFKKEINGKTVEDYHSHRNFDVQTLNGSIKTFIENNYYVFRMGSIQKEKLRIKNDKVIDYPYCELKSDFADFFLLSNCHLYFGSNSGTADLPRLFKRHLSYINFQTAHFFMNFCKTSPSLVKKLFCKKTKKFLSFKDMYDKKLFGISDSRIFDSLGYLHINNTEEEITELSKEVLQSIEVENYYNSKEKEAFEEYYRIANYYSIKNNKDDTAYRPLKLGKDFLMKNLYLIS